MKQVHMTLQGKGGVGKSLVASLLAQYLADKGENPRCIDTDPVNATFAGYGALKVERLELLDADKKISERQFDTMMEWVLTEDRHFVIDNGASSFVPLSAYLVENDAPRMIQDAGKQLVIHTVVTGGQALLDTLGGLASIVQQMPPEVRVVVWRNDYFGEVVADGKPLEQLAAYARNRERIHGVVVIERQSSDTFRKDLEAMLDAKLTFAEALSDDRFGLMPRQRLTQLQRRFYERVGQVM